MSANWKTVRVFISSTFRDMQAERDHLVRFVFPRLREELLKHRIHFIDVDLRWGVTSDQDALGVCREIIDECHPSFMGMLGGRYGWVPDGQDKSITADEIHYSVLGREAEKRGQTFFYFRSEADTLAIPDADAYSGGYREFPQPDEIERHGPERATAMARERAGKLAALKQSIFKAGLPVFNYTAKWDAAQKRLTGLKDFGDKVHANLLQSLKNDPDIAARFTTEGTAPPDEFAEAAEQMEAFIEERTERFVTGSREPLLRDMLAFAAADGMPNIFVLTGDPGSGKSAFLAEFVAAVFSPQGSTRSSKYFASSAPFRGQPFLLIPHFIGASTGSTDLRRTLRRLCHELALAAGNTEPLPLDIKDLIPHFQKLLAEAAGTRRVILVFDALNQFDATDGAHRLNWLPRGLPPGVRIVASVIAPAEGEKEHQILAILRNRKDARVDELKLLAESDTLAIIEGYLKRYSKRLSPEQLAALLAKPAGRLPLYVLTALEELRTLGTYEEITDRIRTLPGDTRALFGWILTERLACDPGFRDREGRPCGAALVEKFAACLGVSRHGLSPAELTALLDPGDPLGNVAALLRLLRPYLMRRGELLDFYHGQFREAATAAHLATREKQRAAHQSVATCLQAFADPHRDGQCRDATPHALSELPHHQTRAEAWPDLVATLENIFFLEAKVTHGMAFDLAEDFSAAVLALPTEHPERVSLHRLDEALRRDIHFVARHAQDYPQAIFQCLWNSCSWLDPDKHPNFFALDKSQMWSMHEGQDYSHRPHLPVSNASSAHRVGHSLTRLLESWRSQKSNRTPEFLWLRSYRPPSLPIGMARSVSVALSREITKSTQVTVRSLHFISDTGLLLTGSSDGKVEIWDSSTGLRQAVFVAQSRGVCKSAVDRMGEFVVLASWDGSIQVHDWRSGILLRRIEAHRQGVTGIAVSPHGHLLASYGADKCINVWNRATGAHVARHECEQSVITIHDITWGCEDDTLFFTDGFVVWRWEHRRSQPGLVASNVISIASIACSPDGKCLACGSRWGPVVTLNSMTGELMHTLRGHSEGKLHNLGPLTIPNCQEVGSVAFSHDGRHIASAGADGTVRVWNVATGVQEDLFIGHDDYCLAVSFSSDGKKVASASQDATVRVWERGTSAGGAVPIDHAALINRIAFSPNGQTIATCSDDCSIGVWDGLSGAPVVQMKGHDAKVIQIEWSPDNRFLLSGGADAKVRIWDMTIMTEAFSVQVGGGLNSIGAMCWFPGSSIAVYSDSKGTIFARDVPHRVQVGELRGHFKSVTGISILPQLALMASCSMDGTIRVWSLDGKREPIVLQTPEAKMWGPNPHIHVHPMPEYRKRMEEQGYRAINLSSDGNFLVSVADDGKGRVWELQNAKEILCFHPIPYAKRIAFAHKGKLIVSSRIVSDFGDQKLEIWDTADGRQVECLAGVTDLVIIANTPKTHPWLILGQCFETIVISVENRRPLAFYPLPLRNVSAHPTDGHLWAGNTNHHLELVRIERG